MIIRARAWARYDLRFHVQSYCSLSLQKGNQKWTYRRTLVIWHVSAILSSIQSEPSPIMTGKTSSICTLNLSIFLAMFALSKIPIDFALQDGYALMLPCWSPWAPFPNQHSTDPTYCQHIYIYINYSMRHHETLALLLFKTTWTLIGFKSAVV